MKWFNFFVLEVRTVSLNLIAQLILIYSVIVN